MTDDFKSEDFEERYIHAIQRFGVNLGVFVLGTSAVLAFVLALIRLLGAIVFLLDVEISVLVAFFGRFNVEEKPIVLMLVDIVDASLLAAILLVFAFGLKSVFLGRRYRLVAFDIRNIDELKEYLVGLIITLIGTRFLEQTLRERPGDELLSMGLGTAAVIIALGAYDYILKLRREPRAGQ